MTRRVGIVVTCEHASARIPRRYIPLFGGKHRLLASHRAYDLGAAEVAIHVARVMGAPVVLGRASRLLIDLNRSSHHPQLFSEISRALPRHERDRILREIYEPHWAAATRAVDRARQHGFAVHWAIHSFTPVLEGTVRDADIGILYDPARSREKRMAKVLRSAITKELPGVRVRRNYPYRGVADGLATALRRRCPGSGYAGLEIEINQSMLGTARARRNLARGLAAAMVRAIGDARSG